MCTVTFIPTAEGIVLTSSRDERALRKTIAPIHTNVGSRNLLFPKDEIAGGTWIAASDDFRVACLLNGAFTDHKKKSFYRKSRGLVLLDSFQQDTFESFINSYDFEGIEPFTLLLFTLGDLPAFIELRWDGSTLFQKLIDTAQKHIWSSATLYSAEIRTKREQLFRQWLENHTTDEYFDILKFHNTKHRLNAEHDILMEREGDLRTVSITQLMIRTKTIDFHYHDLMKNQLSKETITKN